VSSARNSLLNAQQCMSTNADQARRGVQLSVGEYVLLSTKFLRLFHVGRKKLLNKYLAPFEILSRKVAVAYGLHLPASTSRVFNELRVSLLKQGKDGNRGSAPLCQMMVKWSVKLTRSLHTVTPRLVRGHTMCNGKVCLLRNK